MALVVRAIRALDRRGGLASERAAATYARHVGLFAGLHRAVEEDVVGVVAGRPMTVVDIGAGPGDLLAALAPRLPAATLVGVDPAPAMRDLAAARGVVELDGRAERLPFVDASVDLAVSTLSSHHWDDPVAAFAELRRVLARGGEARIYDVRFAGFGAAEARAIARSAGLRPEAVEHRVVAARLLALRAYSLITLRA